jgi:hypothetical protein
MCTVTSDRTRGQRLVIWLRIGIANANMNRMYSTSVKHWFQRVRGSLLATVSRKQFARASGIKKQERTRKSKRDTQAKTSQLALLDKKIPRKFEPGVTNVLRTQLRSSVFERRSCRVVIKRGMETLHSFGEGASFCFLE